MAFIVGFAMIGDRAVIGLSTGGRGVLGVVTFAAPAAAVIAIARFGVARTLAFVRHPAFLVGAAPFLTLMFVLPILGDMFNGYPDRTLIAITAATTATSFLVLGAAVSAAPLHRWSPWIAGAILVQLAYAGGQAIYLNRGPGWELFTPFHAWDLSFQALYGAFVQARSTGLFFNPNELGLWAGTGAILGWTLLSRRLRLAGVGLAVVTLLLSQSRGASVALVAAVLVGVALATLRGRTTVAGAARGAIALLVAASLAVVAVVVFEPSQGLIDRFSALAAVWTQGPQADANLAGRLDYWSAVIDLNAVYPWGTWGPPELLLGSAVDSTWFSVFAQGSMPYVGALLLLLATSFATLGTRFGDTLVPLTVLIAVAGLTQTPLSYPVIYLWWALLGAAIQSLVTDREASSELPGLDVRARSTIGARGTRAWAARGPIGGRATVSRRPNRGDTTP